MGNMGNEEETLNEVFASILHLDLKFGQIKNLIKLNCWNFAACHWKRRVWGVMGWKNERRLKVKKAPCVQTWKQACPICLRQGLRQRWRVARGRGLGDPTGERPENEKPIDRGQTCLSGRQSKRGGGLQLDEEWA